MGPEGRGVGVLCLIDSAAVDSGGKSFVRHSEEVYPQVVVERAAVLEVGRNAGRPEGAIADPGAGPAALARRRIMPKAPGWLMGRRSRGHARRSTSETEPP